VRVEKFKYSIATCFDGPAVKLIVHPLKNLRQENRHRDPRGSRIFPIVADQFGAVTLKDVEMLDFMYRHRCDSVGRSAIRNFEIQRSYS